MKLLREYYELCEGGVCQDLLTEDEKRFVASGGMMLSGKLQEADVQNGNGRVYPHKVLMREVENYKKLVKEKRALGELDHPDDSVINLKNASHMVTDIWMEDKAVMGKVKVLNTPSGQVLKSLVESSLASLLAAWVLYQRVVATLLSKKTSNLFALTLCQNHQHQTLL